MSDARLAIVRRSSPPRIVAAPTRWSGRPICSAAASTSPIGTSTGCGPSVWPKSGRAAFDEPNAFGMSVLQMLAAPCPASLLNVRPSGAAIRHLDELELPPEEREERLSRLEEEAITWDRHYQEAD